MAFLGVPPLELLKYSLITNLLFLLFLVIGYVSFFDVAFIWLKAWVFKKPVSLEWTRSKEWKFSIPDIPKKFPYVWRINDGQRPIQVRREAVGLGPHKVPIMLSTSEFLPAVSPSEINGKLYYRPHNMFRGYKRDGRLFRMEEPSPEDYKVAEYANSTILPEADRERGRKAQEKILDWENSEWWSEYPQHGLNPSEFTSYQEINADPVIMEAYADFAELEARKEAYNPLLVVAQNMHVLIPAILIMAIAWIILQDHSMAMKAGAELNSCKAHITQLYQTGQCFAGAALDTFNASTIKGGGIVK